MRTRSRFHPPLPRRTKSHPVVIRTSFIHTVISSCNIEEAAKVRIRPSASSFPVLPTWTLIYPERESLEGCLVGVEHHRPTPRRIDWGNSVEASSSLPLPSRANSSLVSESSWWPELFSPLAIILCSIQPSSLSLLATITPLRRRRNRRRWMRDDDDDDDDAMLHRHPSKKEGREPTNDGEDGRDSDRWRTDGWRGTWTEFHYHRRNRPSYVGSSRAWRKQWDQGHNCSESAVMSPKAVHQDLGVLEKGRNECKELNYWGE